jgi:hypothetical protein
MTTPNQNEKIAGIPADKAREAIENRKATAEANKVPFPGALAAAFAAPQTVEIGGYKIYPFCDGYIDVLQTLNHPLAKLLDKDDEDGWGADIKSTRGQLAWNLCYLMTTPVDEIEKLVETPENWVPEFEKLAKAKFKNVLYRTLVGLQTVIVQQFVASHVTVIGFEESDDTGNPKKKLSTEPPESKTDSVGP